MFIQKRIVLCILFCNLNFYSTIFSFLKKVFTYLFLERGQGREKEREKYRCARDVSISYLSHAPNWGPGVQPRHVPWLEIEPVTFWFSGRQASTQSTEPYQPGLFHHIFSLLSVIRDILSLFHSHTKFHCGMCLYFYHVIYLLIIYLGCYKQHYVTKFLPISLIISLMQISEVVGVITSENMHIS